MQLQKCQSLSLSSWHTRDVNQIYQKIEQVGEGTYGKVFKASKQQLEEKKEYVALKQLITDKETEGFPLTALREVKILQQLNHENIIKLHEVVISKKSELNANSSIFLVFDYIEHDIFGLLQNSVIFTDAQIKCIMHQLLTGLEYLHSKNIVHRDIKSANLLYGNNGVLKLGDFGLSNVIKNRPLTNRVVTLCYRAPEILLGSKSYNTKIDLWSAGCVMAEFYIKRILFLSDSELNQIKLILERCGFSHENWPEAQTYPFFSDLRLKADNNNNNTSLAAYLKKLRPNMDENALDLIVNLIELNPNKRLSASEALQHKYFKSYPEICPLADMPKLGEGKELHAKKKEKNQQQNNPKVQMKPFGKQQPQQIKFNPQHPNSNKNYSFNSLINQGRKRVQQQQQFPVNYNYRFQQQQQQQFKFNNASYNASQNSFNQNFNRQIFPQPEINHKVLVQKQLNNQEQQTEINTNFIQQQEVQAKLKVELKQYQQQAKSIAKQHSSSIYLTNNNYSESFEQFCVQPIKKIKQAQQTDI